MEFEWDPAKAASNLRRHGVDFPDAVTALSDPFAATREDDHVHEIRHLTLGLDASGRLLVVCYTVRGRKIRLISARNSTRRERRQYEESL